MTLLFTTFLLQFTAFLLQFTAVTIFYCSLLFFTASYHIFTASYHIGDQNFKKKNLPKITTIYCNFTANLQQQFTALVVLQLYFLLFRHRNTNYFLLRYTTIYCILTAIYCLYYFLLQFTASYRDLPRFTAIYRPSGTTVSTWHTQHSVLVCADESERRGDSTCPFPAPSPPTATNPASKSPTAP